MGTKRKDLPFLLHLFHSPIYHAHLVYLSVYLVCLRSTTPLWFTDNTGSRVRFERDKGTAPPKPVRKMWTTGSIPATDKDFLEWLGRQSSALRARGTVYVMNLYVNQLNVECQTVYELQLKEHKERLHSSEPVDAVPANEPCETN